MSKKLLIDARQEDETRVVLLNNNKIEDFDHETSHRKQLKGNIYLARVTRVEPSLQAAFVEYGGHRQGFLAFSEIHPDYYRIPIEDREKLLAEEEARAVREDSEDSASGDDGNGSDDNPANGNGSDDSDEELRSERRRLAQFARHYKIQEVISRRQILLIQVVKEERGTKGAALTTYISLAGRYCVLMPNTHHGGGVSRKISNPSDRKKLKAIMGGLSIPKGMAVIVRTAGLKRTKAEISRDFTYLSRQWDDIREMTMESIAPALIHEEGNLVKRAIRDYYTSDVDEILVAGEAAHKAARGHMKNLMPSHVKKVKAYEDTSLPLFQRYQVEVMLAAMHDPQVPLKSGGYLVINQAEALVAIDVNSGRATRERNIEETALKTNLEAAEEIAHQLRQRDLAGLIVIDFIDMEVNRNRHAVERKLKEAMRLDRARIQLGSISQFGLLEMSRQRLRPSLAEAMTDTCPHCQGTGRVRSVESAALQVLRSLEAEATKGRPLHAYMNASIAIYILNNKRDVIAAMEERLGITIHLHQDDSLIAPAVRFGDDPLILAAAAKSEGRPNKRRGRKDSAKDTPAPTDGGGEPRHQQEAHEDDEDKPRRRRRRGKRGGRKRRRDHESGADITETGAETAAQAGVEAAAPDTAAPDTAASDTAASETATSETAAPDTDDAPSTKAGKKRGRKTPQEVTHEEVQGETQEGVQKAASMPAKKTAKKAAKRVSRKKTPDTSIDTSGDTGIGTKAKKKAAKAPSAEKSLEKSTEKSAKKAAKKAAQKAAPKAKKARKHTAKKAATPTGDTGGQTATTSSPVEVVNIDAVKPATRKKGWWSS